MNVEYWNRRAESFDEEIFDLLGSDRTGILTETLRSNILGTSTVCDFGCGVGRCVPLLSGLAHTVHAMDVSSELLKTAKNRCKHLDNVNYCCVDLADHQGRLPKVDVGVCINVLLMPQRRLRDGVLRSLSSSVRVGGTLILVVQSVESILFAAHREIEWWRCSGVGWTAGRSYVYPSSWMTPEGVIDGVFRVGGVVTKHYLKEELEVLVRSAGFECASIEKVEYGWDHIYDEPPNWMQSPFPWDWMVTAKRVP